MRSFSIYKIGGVSISPNMVTIRHSKHAVYSKEIVITAQYLLTAQLGAKWGENCKIIGFFIWTALNLLKTLFCGRAFQWEISNNRLKFIFNDTHSRESRVKVCAAFVVENFFFQFTCSAYKAMMMQIDLWGSR